MSEFGSVLKLAQEVSQEANRIKSGKAAELNAERVLNRVSESHAALEGLNQVVSATRRLAVVSDGAASLALADLDDGRADFERLARGLSYLPSNVAFEGAKKRIGGTTNRVTADLATAWTQWTDWEVSKVPRHRISLLDQGDQKAANERWANVLKTAKAAIPTRGHINSFKSDLDYLHELLDPLPDPPGVLIKILERLGQRRGLTLAELTDQEIAALRQAGVADQIEVRRRGA
jgi:hypothetical protein